MNVAVIDAEIIGKNKHRFPNLCSMKIAAYHKQNGDSVQLKTDYEGLQAFDKVYISKVFTKTHVPEDVLAMPNVVYGGTGFFYDNAPPLPPEIEHIMPDYHIYDDWVNRSVAEGTRWSEFKYYQDYSIGYLTRKCFRGCKFCVNQNYKKVEVASPLEEFLDISRPKVCFLDDNFFGHPKWKELIRPVVESGKKFQFKQGLDERLLTDDKVAELAKWKYDGDYIFAFDNIEDYKLIEEKAVLIRKYIKTIGQNLKFYVLCGFDRADKYDDEFWRRDIEDLFKRIYILSKYNFKPYVMRYEKYKDSPLYGSYVNIACWCNQPSLFNNLSYEQFCEKDDMRKTRGQKTSATWRYYDQLLMLYPEFESYFHIIPKDIRLDYSSW